MLETDQLPDNMQPTKERKEGKTKSQGKLTHEVHGRTLPSSLQTLKIHSLFICKKVGEREEGIPRLLNKEDHI